MNDAKTYFLKMRNLYGYKVKVFVPLNGHKISVFLHYLAKKPDEGIMSMRVEVHKDCWVN